MSALKLKNPMANVKLDLTNPLKDEGNKEKLKKAHKKVLETMGMNEPKSPLGKKES